METVSNWNNLNENRDYPLAEDKARDIPRNIISDLQIFTVAPRYPDGKVYGSAEKLFSEDISDMDWPKVVRLDVTRHMVTVVVECSGCTLFCTKSLSDIVPYEPVAFVSETGTATGWIAFGDFDRGSRFSFAGRGDEAAVIDPRAVILYPTSTIGGLVAGDSDTVLSGDVKIVAGSGLACSVDEKTNSLVMSLEDNSDNRYSDPCYIANAVPSSPAVGSIAGVEAENGTIILAFTGEKLPLVADPPAEGEVKKLDAADILEMVETVQDEDIEVWAEAVRFPDGKLDDGTYVFQDLIGVKVHTKAGVRVQGYRLVYVPANAGMRRRELEFSIHSGYHMPQYDAWTRQSMLPGLSELYRSIRIADLGDSTPTSPYLDGLVSVFRIRYPHQPSRYRYTAKKTLLESQDWDDVFDAVPASISEEDWKTRIWTDDMLAVDDPYSSDLEVRAPGEMTEGSDVDFLFSHRIRNTAVAGTFDSLYVEILYSAGSDVKSRATKKNIPVYVFRSPDGNSALRFDSVVRYVLSGEKHGYEFNYAESNRYDTENNRVLPEPDGSD